MSNKPSVGQEVEKISQNRLKMAKIDNFSKEIQLFLNHIQSKIFEILGVDKQMVIICVQDEPNRSPQKSVFGSVIGVYLMSFFYEHPVHSNLLTGTNPEVGFSILSSLSSR